MHILVVNDDGPPSNQSSPYVHSLVHTLQQAGHTVSVVLPHTQRSWIGKAHLIGHTVKPTYFRPGTLHKDDGTTHSRPLPRDAKDEQEEWILVDGTPASCVQIGLYHYFQEKGPINLVVSGPNYGRNSTAVFSLSSGTLGGAMEAAICKKKAIALSYAFFSRNHDPEIIAGASQLSVKVIEYLYNNWGSDVDLYTVNVPLIEDVGSKKVLWTNMLQNYWSSGSCFEAVDVDTEDADEEEHRIREAESPSATRDAPAPHRHAHKQFKWAPRFTDVYKSVEESEPGNDGWAVQEGYTSVTALKANFMHAASDIKGEIKLNQEAREEPDLAKLSISPAIPQIAAVIKYEDEYVQPLICAALESRLPKGSLKMVDAIESDSKDPVLQIRAYEEIDFDHLMAHTSTSLSNAYIIRKALIRKHYLSATISNWITKHPESVLAKHTKPSCHFELDYAEFLDDALVEAWELQESFQKNEEKEPQDREWWILKPGMSDRGQGIRLFSTYDELQGIFEEWEADRPDSDDEDEGEEGGTAGQKGEDGDYIITSHLRHFIAQPYIDPPLLISGDPRKFHIRTYVLAVGGLKVYVYHDMLALFARDAYVAPSSDSSPDSLPAHLTNTCIQSSFPLLDGSASHDLPTVQTYWSLPSSHPTLGDDYKTRIFDQICEVTGQTFVAAAKEMSVHFQAIPNAFEVFGVDFLVDASGDVFLLEVNAFPDFRQTGDELKGLVGGLWEGVVDVAIADFFGLPKKEDGKEKKMVLVGQVDLGKR